MERRTAAVLLLLVAGGCAATPPEAAPPDAEPAPAPASAPEPPPPPLPPPAPPPPSPPPPPEPTPPPAPASFVPSGIREDFVKYNQARAASRAARTEDAKEAAVAALDALTADLVAKWSAREVPAQECQYWGTLLRAAGRFPEAAAAYRSYLAVADPGSSNVLNCTTALVDCLGQAGDFEGAEAELDRAAGTVFADHPEERSRAGTVLAICLMNAGRLAAAAARFEDLVTLGPGDSESAIHGVDCLLRLERRDDAARLAAGAAAWFRGRKEGDRMDLLVDQVAMIGRPSPGFASVRWWKGAGPAPRAEDLEGKVVVVFSWNMQAPWARWFFERVGRLHADCAPRGVVFVGISRLQQFDPVRMVVDETLSEEAELEFYDAWTREYGVDHPLAVGSRDGDLMNDWNARVVPMFVVVGKDGRIAYVRTGKNEEHLAILREVLERELER